MIDTEHEIRISTLKQSLAKCWERQISQGFYDLWDGILKADVRSWTWRENSGFKLSFSLLELLSKRYSGATSVVGHKLWNIFKDRSRCKIFKVLKLKIVCYLFFMLTYRRRVNNWFCKVTGGCFKYPFLKTTFPWALGVSWLHKTKSRRLLYCLFATVVGFVIPNIFW